MATVLVTGGSKGVGFELAKQFAADGYDIVISARTGKDLSIASEKISSQFGVKVTQIQTDLSSENGPLSLYKELKRKVHTIDVLVNNAGIGLFGPFLQTDSRSEEQLLHLNIISVVKLSRLFLPEIIRNNGGILNVASTAAFQPGPMMSVYYASKAFVLSFSEALAQEYSDQGIKISVLCPGPTRSAFYLRGAIDNTKLIKSGLVKLMEPQRAAFIGYNGFKKGKRIIIPGLKNQIGAFLAKLAPLSVSAKFVKALNQTR